jgi:ABC-type uncharacterized transport system involved in gliding motility auxiliary subunit
MNIREKLSGLRERLSSRLNIDERNLQLMLVILIIILFNIVMAAFPFRIDLTRNNNYSLTAKSKEAVSTLHEKLSIKVLFSKDLPAEHAAVRRYLTDMLEEYNFYGNRYFSYEIVPEEQLKEQAADYGINPVVSTEFVKDQLKKRSVYMAVVIQHADLTETIDALTTTVGIEYEITSRIEKMAAKVDLLRSMKDNLMLTLYLDPRVLKLGIENIDSLEEIVRKAVDKNNLMNYDRLRFQVLDPSLLPREKDPSVRYGLTMVKWRPMGGMPGGITPFGMVLEGNGRFKRIDFDLMPTLIGTTAIVGLETLSDRINVAIGDILGSGRKIVYARGHGIPELSDMRSFNGAGLLQQMLSQSYELVEVDLASDEIPADAGVLIINGPQEAFTDIEKYRIDQYVMQGRALIYFANNFVEHQTQQMMGGSVVLPVETGLDELFASYGIKIGKNWVLDRNSAPINYGDRIMEYPLIPLISGKGLSRESVITKYLNTILVAKASSIEIDENIRAKGVRFTDLASTSEQSWIMEGRMQNNPLFMVPPDAAQLKSYRVAVLAEGRFDSFWKGRAAPAADAKKQSHIMASSARLDATVESGTSRIIVVGCSDITLSGVMSQARKMLSNRGMGEAYSNDIFIHGMVDYLAGRDYVPEMKSKSLDYNPLEKTDEDMRFVYKLINMVLVPASVVVTGVVVWRRRRVRRRIIETEFAGGDSI